MVEFNLESLGVSINLSFQNFKNDTLAGSLIPLKKGTKTDLSILLYEDKKKTVIQKIKKTEFKNCVKKVRGGSYCTFFDIDKRKTFSFFEKDVFLGFVMDHALNRSFLAFQNVLDIIFLHAAAIVIKERAYLFIAPGGGGKSTISSLAKENGFRVIDEECCIIKRIGNRFFSGVYPIKPLSDTSDKIWEIGGVYFLNKSNKSRTRKLSAIDAVYRSVPEATSFYHNWVPDEDKNEYKKRIFTFLNSMFNDVYFRLLDFKIDSDVFSCLTH